MSRTSRPEPDPDAPRQGEPARVRIYQAVADDAGQRLDNLLLRLLKGVPRSRIYRLLRTGQVRVGGRRARPTYRVAAGDEVRLPPVRQAPVRAPEAAPARAGALAAGIVYEDEAVLVVDKPSGWVVHGGTHDRLGVIEALRTVRPDASLELVHRLDRETSGCLLLAKGRQALRRLHAQWHGGTVEKRYLVLLQGSWGDAPRRVEAPIRRQPGGQGARERVTIDPAGKPSVTDFRPLQSLPGCTLVEAVLHTGRMHQIRVHAAHVGHPVAGDGRYGDRDVRRAMRGYGLKRLFLHAHALAFRTPATGEEMVVSAPLPEDLNDVINRLQANER